LQKVAIIHNAKIAEKNPTIADLNDPLKAINVYEVTAWRKIQYLGAHSREGGGLMPHFTTFNAKIFSNYPS
jgi:hypothetical protein